MKIRNRSGFRALIASGAMVAGTLVALPGSVALATDLGCTVTGTPDSDTWVVAGFVGYPYPEIAADAVVCGGGGDDTILNNEDSAFSGTFYGGKGNDAVGYLTGRFEGGLDQDGVIELAGGTFIGGKGGDVVFVACSGAFDGGQGSDVAGVGGGSTASLTGVETVIDQSGIPC